MKLGNMVVGRIICFSAMFQGIAETCPTFLAAVLDNGLYALMVFTLPGILGWGIEAIWWIKLITALLEMGFCGLWLKWELRRMPLKYNFS